VAENGATVVDDAKPAQQVSNIDWRNPARLLLLSLLVPVTAAVGLDVWLATLPLLTMAASLICIPLATLLVVRSILAEFDRVIEIVAPEQDDDPAIENDRNPGVMPEKPGAAPDVSA